MPSTMQQSMVSARAIIMWPPERLTIVLNSLEARPVTVMQPEIMPATPQATATVMEPLAPPSRASMILPKVRKSSRLLLLLAISTTLLTRPTATAATIAMAAEKAMVYMLVETMTTNSTRGARR